MVWGLAVVRRRPDLFFPPGIVIQDERAVYQRQLRQAKERQAERDMMHEAWIDNLFYGVPYRSLCSEMFGREIPLDDLKKELQK